jgi:hypothetical protein
MKLPRDGLPLAENGRLPQAMLSTRRVSDARDSDPEALGRHRDRILMPQGSILTTQGSIRTLHGSILMPHGSILTPQGSLPACQASIRRSREGMWPRHAPLLSLVPRPLAGRAGELERHAAPVARGPAGSAGRPASRRASGIAGSGGCGTSNRHWLAVATAFCFSASAASAGTG